MRVGYPIGTLVVNMNVVLKFRLLIRRRCPSWTSSLEPRKEEVSDIVENVSLQRVVTTSFSVFQILVRFCPFPLLYRGNELDSEPDIRNDTNLFSHVA